jgi:signal transduction histidine kinase
VTTTTAAYAQPGTAEDGGIDISTTPHRTRDLRRPLTLLVCGAALAATGIMAVSRLALPTDGSYIPTERWNWTSDGVEVAPLSPSSPFRSGDIVVALDGRPLADLATAAVLPPWFLAPQPLGSVVDVLVRRDGQLVDLAVMMAPFSTDRLAGAPLGLVVFGAGALMLTLVLVLRRPQATAIRLLFIGVCCNTADILAWEVGLQPTDFLARSPFLYAFAFAALANLIFWACLVHLLSIYPVRAGWLARRHAGVAWIYLAPLLAFSIGAIGVRLVGGTTLEWFDRLGTLLAVVVSGMLVAILVSIVAGYLRTPAPRRRQVRVLAVTLGVAAGASLVLTSLPIAVLGHPLAPRSAVAILAIPVILALALAVIRDRLFQVDLLATSRRRIIAAREEERLRLRRDLHDGLGPTLAALGLKVDRARAEAAANPDAVGPLLDEIRADLRGALSQIRTLSRELRPPGLDALGLVDTLHQQLVTVAGPDGPVVEIDATDIGALPPAIEVAAYRIVVEAVTNTVRHAGARFCQVSPRRDGGSLVLRVVDDGRGIEHGPVGVGTRAMYERAAEVGGELLVAASPDGGTVVSASLPLDPAGRAAASPAAASAAGTGPSLPPDTLESVTQR